MKSYKEFILLIIIICVSCSKPDICQNGSSFELAFSEELKTLRQGISRSGELNRDAIRAYSLLEELTSIRGGVVIGGDVFMYDRSDFSKDKENWCRWLQEEGCQLSSDSLFKVKNEVRQSTYWMD